MTAEKTRRAVLGLVAASVLVIGGAVTAVAQIGDPGDPSPSTSPSDGTSPDEATEDDAGQDDAGQDDAGQDDAGEDAADEESADEDADEDEAAEGDTENDGAADEESGSRGPKAACALTSPPDRAAVTGTDPADHPGWTRGRHLGWCVAAQHGLPSGSTTKPGKDAAEKHPEKSARPGAAPKTKPHPGKGLAKGHGKAQGKGHGKHR